MRKHFGARLVVLLAGVTVAAVAVTPAPAKKNDPNVQLEFRPTNRVGATIPPLLPAGTSISIVVEDDRRVEEVDLLGTRTNGADETFTLRATGDVADFVARALRTAAESWGLTVSENAPNRLLVDVSLFRLFETNQPVGASYESEVRLVGRMELPGGVTVPIHKLGDAFRYGKKFSNANCNEVLSDALRDAFGALLDDKRLWAPAGGYTVAGARTGTAEPLSPEGLLDQLLKLQVDGFEDATIATFLRQQALTRSLTATDLQTWKTEGATEAWMQAALRLPVR